MISINDTDDSLRIVDHYSAAPGSGSGKAPRKALLSKLAHEVRDSTKPIYGEARIESLRETYLDDLNQLATSHGGHVVRRKTPSGKLRIKWYPQAVPPKS